MIARWEDAADLVTDVDWFHTGNKLAIARHDQSLRVFEVGDEALRKPVVLSGHDPCSDNVITPEGMLPVLLPRRPL